MPRFAIGLVVSSLVAGAALAEPGPTLAPASRQGVDLATLPADKFESLPGDALVTFKGRTLTKAQFLAEMDALRAGLSSRKAPRRTLEATSAPSFSALRTRLLASEKQRVEAANQSLPALASTGGNTGLAPTPTPDPCASPKIKAVSSAPPLEPGEQLILNGCGFGPSDPASELRFVGDFPAGFLKLHVLHWQGNAIKAVVPPVSGVKDQSAKLQVVRKDLQFSNEWPMAFRATRDVWLLTLNDLRQTCASGPKDVCDPKTRTARGYHASGGFALHFGTDRVWGTLKNGCVVAGWGWDWYGDHATLLDDPTLTLSAGATDIDLNFKFETWITGQLLYEIDLYAMGPVGVSCH